MLGARSDRPPISTPMAAILGLLGALLLASLSLRLAGAQEPDSPTALTTAKKLHDAFNRHDSDAMALLVASDFELYYISEEGVAGLAVRGPEQLAADMTRYFADRPSVGSTIVGVVDGPVFVSFREQIVRGQGEPENGPSSLVVYEVNDGLIRRTWYFPAETEQDPRRAVP